MSWNRYNTTKSGYRHDRIIYAAAFTIIILFFLAIAAKNKFDFRTHPYVKCTDEQCENPYYGQPCKQQLKILFFIKLYETPDCRVDSENAWLEQEYLSRGEHGTPPTHEDLLFLLFSTFCIGNGLWINHFFHNRGKTFDFDIIVSKKYRWSLSEIIQKVKA